MKKAETIVAKAVAHFARVMGVPPTNVQEAKIRNKLCNKIIDVVKRRELTHLQVAKLANTYPTSISSILNRRTYDISTRLMIRVLVSLGVRAKTRTSSIH